MTPSFWKALGDPAVRNVLLCGCGGGLDFVHGLLLVPHLKALGKQVVIGSYSFGDLEQLAGEAPVVFDAPPAVVKRVTARTTHGAQYAPEVHVCSFLDERLPAGRPHFVYAYHARDFAVPTLTAFYRQVVVEHAIDAIVLVDGGTDSLVTGLEHGLGDPIEDAVSVQGVAALEEVGVRILVNVGLGVDRHNGVSDHASLRAIAELARHGGFLGALALERGDVGYEFYRDGIEHVFARQTFHSVVCGSILGAVEGGFGADCVPALIAGRVSQGSLFLWPLMGMLWAFDVETVAARSRLGAWLREAPTPAACYEAVRAGRRHIQRPTRDEERLPEPRPWVLEDLFESEAVRDPSSRWTYDPRADAAAEDPMTIEIRHEEEAQRFVAEVDGAQALVQYGRPDARTIDLFRTYTPDALRGRGIAGRIVEAAPEVRTGRGPAGRPDLSVRGALHREARGVPGAGRRLSRRSRDARDPRGTDSDARRARAREHRVHRACADAGRGAAPRRGAGRTAVREGLRHRRGGRPRRLACAIRRVELGAARRACGRAAGGRRGRRVEHAGARHAGGARGPGGALGPARRSGLEAPGRRRRTLPACGRTGRAHAAACGSTWRPRT